MPDRLLSSVAALPTNLSILLLRLCHFVVQFQGILRACGNCSLAAQHDDQGQASKVYVLTVAAGSLDFAVTHSLLCCMVDVVHTVCC